MTVIHGNISKVLEIEKIAHTEKENIVQSGWVYFLSATLPPGTTGYDLIPTPSGKTGILKIIAMSCQNNGNFMFVELRKASDPANDFFSSYFINKYSWDLNDTIISAGDHLQLVITNNAVGNVAFTNLIFIIDAVGILI